MRKITSTAELKASIFLLEQKQKEESFLLKEELLVVVNNLKPSNIIKSAIQDFSKSSGIKNSLINSGLSLAAGYFSKRVVAGGHPNIFKQVLGTLVQVGISSVVSKNSDGIISGVTQLVKLFMNKKETVE